MLYFSNLIFLNMFSKICSFFKIKYETEVVKRRMLFTFNIPFWLCEKIWYCLNNIFKLTDFLIAFLWIFLKMLVSCIRKHINLTTNHSFHKKFDFRNKLSIQFKSIWEKNTQTLISSQIVSLKTFKIKCQLKMEYSKI